MELAWEFSLKEGTDFERQDKGLLQVGASVCSGLVRLEPRCGASSILQGVLGADGESEKGQVPSSQGFQAWEINCPSGTEGHRISPGHFRAPSFISSCCCCCCGKHRVETPALKELPDSSVAPLLSSHSLDLSGLQLAWHLPSF